jgi:predicted nucleic acid-binding protein
VIALLDSSVVLRKLLGEPHPLADWSRIRIAYASRILPVEVGRVIDRMRLEGKASNAKVAALRAETRRLLQSIEMLALDESVLTRAESALPTPLRTLDAIHLATAIELDRRIRRPFVVATHDVSLARAARASGLDVRGA